MVSISEIQNRISPKFTEQVFMSILHKKAKSEKVEVKKIILGEESKKGDSYLSTVTRYTVEAIKNGDEAFVLNVIVKAYPKNTGRMKTFRSADFFITEVGFYEKVWPKLQAFQESKNVPEKFDNLPLVLATYADSKDGFIAMEDLSFFDYTMAARSEGLDLDHAHLIIKLFAKFHALGFAYKAQHEPGEFEKIVESLPETYFHEKYRGWYQNFHEVLKGIVKDAVEKELDESYVKKLKIFYEKDTLGEINKIIANKDNKLTTITHGDAWVPNFLIKYNGTTPISGIMIDFQLTRCATLSLDLLFFFYSCLDQSVRVTHFVPFISLYVETFQEFALALGTDASWLNTKVILQDMIKCGPFALGMSAEAIVMSLLDDDEVSDIDLIQGDQAVKIEEVWIVGNFKDQGKRLRVANMVKHMIDIGVL